VALVNGVCAHPHLLSCGCELTVNGSHLQTRQIATSFAKNGAKVEHSVELKVTKTVQSELT